MGFLSLLSQVHCYYHFLVNIRRLEDDKHPESFQMTVSKSSSTVTNANGKRFMFKKYLLHTWQAPEVLK
ncbi:hypothetical protein BYT27DRAFT_7183247 [Phlegmacium glaucopus]|nr:hypothetical protein BYT27DRAFT_7183247 [Phlegmacium glaucopus]